MHIIDAGDGVLRLVQISLGFEGVNKAKHENGQQRDGRGLQ